MGRMKTTEATEATGEQAVLDAALRMLYRTSQAAFNEIRRNGEDGNKIKNEVIFYLAYAVAVQYDLKAEDLVEYARLSSFAEKLGRDAYEDEQSRREKELLELLEETWVNETT